MRLPNQSAGFDRSFGAQSVLINRQGLMPQQMILQSGVVSAQLAVQRAATGSAMDGLGLAATASCKCPCCIEVAGHLVCCSAK